MYMNTNKSATKVLASAALLLVRYVGDSIQIIVRFSCAPHSFDSERLGVCFQSPMIAPSLQKRYLLDQ